MNWRQRERLVGAVRGAWWMLLRPRSTAARALKTSRARSRASFDALHACYDARFTCTRSRERVESALLGLGATSCGKSPPSSRD